MFGVVDFEAKNWWTVLCCGYYNGKIYRSFRSTKDLMKFIFSKQVKERTIFAHYGGKYDFRFFLDYAVFHPDEYKIISMIPRGSGFLNIIIQSKKTKKSIKFACSSALLSYSLEKLSKSFQVERPKIDYDFSKLKKMKKASKELLFYMEQDHYALYEVIQKFSDWDDIQIVGLADTISSQALRIFKKLYCPVQIYDLGKSCPQVDIFVRNAFIGGRTEIFKPLFNSKSSEIFCYDVNSLYPFVMANNDFPNEFEGYSYDFSKDQLSIVHCQVEAPDINIPFLGIKHKGKLIFPIGTFSGYWTNKELIYAQKLGYKIVNIFKVANFRNAGRIFEKYVERYYSIRTKADVDGVSSTIAKQLLNHLFGRFCLNLDREELVFDYGQDGIKPHYEIKVSENSFYRISKKEKRIDSLTNSAIGTFVTAYARLHMHELMTIIGEKNIYYTDTDSIFTTKKIDTGIELGQLKREYSKIKIQKACFLLPKSYILESQDNKQKIIKLKGFDAKKTSDFTFDDFTTCLEGEIRSFKKNSLDLEILSDLEKVSGIELKAPIKIKEPIRPASLKQSLKNNKILDLLPENFKVISAKYDKRVLNIKKNTSYPLKMVNNELI